jgi:hypothetical protein
MVLNSKEIIFSWEAGDYLAHFWQSKRFSHVR